MSVAALLAEVEARGRTVDPKAVNLWSLLTLRYEILFRTYYDQAVGGDAEATKICVGIMELTKIMYKADKGQGGSSDGSVNVLTLRSLTR